MTRESATTRQLEQCRWPSLASPYDEALWEAVAFVFGEVEPVGIIAAGTIVRGTPHASSDLDLFVIHEQPYRRRVQRFFHGVPTEIFINPAETVRGYFVEEHRHGRPITAHMLATGFVILGTAPIVDALRRDADEWLVASSGLSAEAIVRDRYAAATRLEDALDVGESDPDSATMLMTLAVTAMLEHRCRLTDGRVPRGKELLDTIARRDADLGRLAHVFFSAPSFDARRAAAESIADRTIDARGFFEWDSGIEPSGVSSNVDDVAAIMALRDAWMAIVASGDSRGLAELVTDDYEVWTHGAPTLGGRRAVVDVMGAALARHSVTQSYEPSETVIAGDWAFQRGVERFRIEPREGGPVRENAQRAFIVLRRGDDGRWRYARGMTNGLPVVTAGDPSDARR